MAKLWALRWQDGEVLQDKQINEKGKFEVKQYTVLPEDKGVFDVAWIEKSRRVFSSHRETLEITKLASANNSYQLKKIGSARVKEDPSWVEAPIFFPNIFASSEKTFYVLLYANVRFRHTLVQRFESSGKLLASTVVKSDVGEIDEFGFDPHTGLYRYVDGGLNSLSGPKRLVEIQWGNFESKVDRVQIKFTTTPIFLRQKATDCFYWLEFRGKGLQLNKRCRLSRAGK